jgi:hypothetical protein
VPPAGSGAVDVGARAGSTSMWELEHGASNDFNGEAGCEPATPSRHDEGQRLRAEGRGGRPVARGAPPARGATIQDGVGCVS